MAPSWCTGRWLPPDARGTASSSNSCAATSMRGRDAACAPPNGRNMPNEVPARQLLHLVFGGELTRLDTVDFKDLNDLDIVGIYPNYAGAYAAWKAKAQQTVDNAHMRYFIVHLHRLLDPHEDKAG